MIENKMDIQEFVMCTDAGLSSGNNRLYNDTDKRKFITAQSVKSLPNSDKTKRDPGKIKDWALNDRGWFLAENPETEYTLTQIRNPENRDLFYDKIFYKQRWYKIWVDDKETGVGKVELEQRCIVSFSIKYMEYLRQKRYDNISKAQKAIEHGNAGESPKSFKSYIKEIKCTESGEPAEISAGYHIDMKRVREEEMYDGFYAVCTNLEEFTDKHGRHYHTIKDIIRINRARWEIEESFRILKTQMKARPVYHRTDKAIKAHFAICFVALFIYRVLEHKLNSAYSTDKILSTLREMNAVYQEGVGFIPSFTRTDLTDKLFDISGFYLDTQIVTLKNIKSAIAHSRLKI